MKTLLTAVLAALALALAPWALAAGGPAATTGSASSITATSAVVSGSVNPNGAATSWQVQYGTSVAYGSATAPASAGSGSAPAPVSAPLGGLAPDTTYHFRIVATSTGGTSDGADATFTTAKAPPAVTGAAPASVTATQALPTATVNPNGIATTVTFQYGHTTSYGSTSAPVSAGSGTAPVRVQGVIGGLSPGTAYHYRAVAASADGTTYGADTAFTTAKAAPGATTGAPSVVLPDGARLTGTVVPNGAATNYQFQYGPTASYGQQSTLTPAGSGSGRVGVGVTIGGLAPGTAYHYRLVAISPDGTTAGADAVFTTTGDPAAAGAPLPPISHTTAVAISSSGAQLNGAINPPAKSTSWWFEYGPTGAYGAQSLTQTMSGLGARPVNVKLTGLAAATTFHYRLELRTSTGLYVGPDATFTTKTLARTRPAGLTLDASATRTAHTVTIAAGGRLESAVPGSCNGTIELLVTRGGQVLALRDVALRGCAYAGHVTLRRGAAGRRVTVAARFTGNATLLPLTRRTSVSSG
jgi:hypothetical protein